MEPKSEPEIVDISKNSGKNASQKQYETKGAEGNCQKAKDKSNHGILASNFGPAGVGGSVLIQGGSYLV